ncbi:MAG: CoA-binding protein [Candidatus Thorarchaeota archaeon]|nr:CoA-binding protein [Candidatus Thorarchaeota archaeon]
MNTQDRPTISEILDISSVAIVGVSPRMGYYWVHAMTQWDHDLDLYLVSRSGGEVMGRTIYSSLSEVPSEIDYVIVAVPQHAVISVLREAVEKGAKAATVFSSGYSELGTEEGRRNEEELREFVNGVDLRVIGPNCMGLMYPRIGFAFVPTIPRLAGDVGFISQSGGVAIAVYTAGTASGLGFSKLFSFGNAVDIKPPEIVDYFISDDETDVLGIYIEGANDGRELVSLLREAAVKKPIVALKGGRSREGSRVAASHTGALAGNTEIWKAALRQANVVSVDTIEDLVGTLSIFSMCPEPESRNVGIVAISGGTSVIYTDLCVEAGLKVPRTSPKIRDRLDPLIQDVGTSLNNPIDLAADYYMDQTISEVITIVGEEESFDSIIIEADAHNIHQIASIMDAEDAIGYYWESLAKGARSILEDHNKPVLVTIPDIAYPEARNVAWEAIKAEDLPIFRNISECIGSLARAYDYYEKRERRKTS